MILIGPNNAGKSNVLDALECFIKNKISKRDKSDTFMKSELRNPVLDLYTIKDSKKYDLKPKNKKSNSKQKEEDEESFDYESYVSKFSDEEQDEIVIAFKEFLSDYQIVNDEDYENNFGSCLKDLIKLYNGDFVGPETADAVDSLENEVPCVTDFFDDYETYLTHKKFGTNKQSNKDESDSEDIDLKTYLPKIIRYSEEHITNNDLNCDAKSIGDSKFFNAILKMMGSDINELENTYDNFKESKNYAILKQQSRKLCKGLDKISKYFNELYHLLDKNVYKFEIDLESSGISFSLSKEETKEDGDSELVALVLDHQSTGFRWFFDLFFNVFASNDLYPGDIIIMDEPATNLHVGGQEELRKFLKDFAVKNGITFIIATHSPFLVSLDYLDEIRLISLHENNVAKIDNVFSAVNVHDADSLKPIRESLTVRSSVLLDPDQIVVFVEGITDYNYLVGMKSLDKAYSNITFLPIHGLGKDTNEKSTRLDQLQKIRKHHSILLIDGDEAGEEFSELNKQAPKKLNILKLSDVNANFKEIENLFSDEDKVKFNVSEKDAGLSVIFKKVIIKNPEEVSQTTKDNFKLLFNAIQKQFPKEEVEQSVPTENESAKLN